MLVVTPIRLLSSVKPSTRLFDRRTSNTENGRRSSGSPLRPDFTMTNWPGLVAAAMSGAASAMTL
jgi:hypothetical protein